MIKVEGHSNLYRDENSGAIINYDSVAYNQYVNSINQKELKRKELDDMKRDIDEIKSLLKEFLKSN
tara:strand:- start:91 stop:288 length:198 start_codon:yes stop_codon:yes gene_type:complete